MLLVLLLFLCLVTQQKLVWCDYDLQVQFHSYFSGICCDAAQETNCSLSEVHFVFCERPATVNTTTGTDTDINVFMACQGRDPISTIANAGPTPCFVDFTDSVFGIPNPGILNETGPWQNETQFYLEVLESDLDELIDRFIINLSLPVNTSIEGTYTGKFERVTLDLSFQVNCSRNFEGNDCASCIPGFTGSDCLTDIDFCEGVTCENNGICVDGLTSFQCNGYELFVSVDSFSNPRQRCVVCDTCCDGNCGACDLFFYLCLRPYGANVVLSNMSRQGCPDNWPIVVTDSKRNIEGFVRFNDTVLGVNNPINFSRIMDPMNGVQLLLEAVDFDSNRNPDDLIDRFVENVTIPVGVSLNLMLRGVFNIAEVGIHLEAQCLPGFLGNFCTIINFCEGVDCNNGSCVNGNSSFTCVCKPGFTGGFCEINIDDCVGVDCGQDRMCVDDVLDFSCLCVPGFTGPDCLTDINECEDITCSDNGVCIDGINSFTCECSRPFFGDLCERRINGYNLLVTINSYNNPNHSCVDCGDCCDSFDCSTGFCDSYFYMCERPINTEFSRSTAIRLGDCVAMLTNVDVDDAHAGANFTDSVLGLSNPIKFSRIANPTVGVQLYIELIDSDGANPDDLVDRFIINEVVPVGTSVNVTNFRGIFDIAEVSLRLEAACEDGFSGDFCLLDQSSPVDSNDTVVIILIIVIIIIILIIAATLIYVFIIRRAKKESVNATIESSNSNFAGDHVYHQISDGSDLVYGATKRKQVLID